MADGLGGEEGGGGKGKVYSTTNNTTIKNDMVKGERGGGEFLGLRVCGIE